MNSASKPNPFKPASILRSMVATAILITFAALWFNQSRTEDRLQELSVENEALKEQLLSTERELDALNSGDSSAETRERLSAARQAAAPVAPVVEIETLFLQEPVVEMTSEGLRVHLDFIPDENIALPEEVTLVVRIPASAEGRIVAMDSGAEDDAGGETNVAVVNAGGRLAMIQYRPGGRDSLKFDLTVSAPVKATVRGSEGILDFEIDITPDGCSVSTL